MIGTNSTVLTSYCAVQVSFLEYKATGKVFLSPCESHEFVINVFFSNQVHTTFVATLRDETEISRE